MLRSVQSRLGVALGLLLLLALAGATPGLPAATLARWGLGLGAVVALAVVWRRSVRTGAGHIPLAARLHVHARAGLSARCGLALVEVDGERFLVAYGEGFATLRRTSPRSRRRGGTRGRPVGARLEGIPPVREVQP